MSDAVKAYMAELEKSMAEFMRRPVSYKSAVAVREMCETWHKLHKMLEEMAENTGS